MLYTISNYHGSQICQVDAEEAKIQLDQRKATIDRASDGDHPSTKGSPLEMGLDLKLLG